MGFYAIGPCRPFGMKLHRSGLLAASNGYLHRGLGISGCRHPALGVLVTMFGPIMPRQTRVPIVERKLFYFAPIPPRTACTLKSVSIVSRAVSVHYGALIEAYFKPESRP